jgi:hypothetical protein
MTKNGLDIQTISTKRTDFQADRVLLLGQVTEKKEKADPSHFLKFLFANRTNGTFGFARHTSQPFAKPKELKMTSLCYLNLLWLLLTQIFQTTSQ